MTDISNKTLFILLHGYGSNGSHLSDVSAIISQNLNNCEVLCPDAPFTSLNRDGCYEWFPITKLKEEYFLEGLRNIFPFILNYVENLIKMGYNSKNIILSGFSQGACVAVYSGLRFPFEIRNIISFSGGLVDHKNIQKEETIHKVPTCFIHGENDRIIPAAFSERAEGIFKKNNNPVELHLIPNQDHFISKESIDIALNFIKRN